MLHNAVFTKISELLNESYDCNDCNCRILIDQTLAVYIRNSRLLLIFEKSHSGHGHPQPQGGARQLPQLCSMVTWKQEASMSPKTMQHREREYLSVQRTRHQTRLGKGAGTQLSGYELFLLINKIN